MKDLQNGADMHGHPEEELPINSKTFSGIDALSPDHDDMFNDQNWLAAFYNEATTESSFDDYIMHETAPRGAAAQSHDSSAMEGQHDTMGAAADHGATHNTTGLTVDYFRFPKRANSLDDINFDAKPAGTEIASSIDSFRGMNRLWDGGFLDKFAVRYSGNLNVDKGGSYTFYLKSDHGSELYIDGKLVIDNDNNGTNNANLETTKIKLSSGAHDIEVRYYENNADEKLRLDWKGPDSGNKRKLIEGDSFSTKGPEGEDCGVDSDHDTGGNTDGDHNDGGHDDGGQDNGGQDSGDGHTDGGQTDGGDHDSGADNGGHDGGSDTDGGHDDGGHDSGDQNNDDSGHGDHGGSDEVTHIPLPTTAKEIKAFVIAVKAEAEDNAHMHDSSKASEHGQLLDLVPRSEATHIAIGNGDWFDKATWYNGAIPGDDAKVLIPKGVTVTYDGESDASLFTVRVDGALTFATDTDTKMLVDTLAVAPTGLLEIGTEDNPVQDGVNAQIVIANNGDIDVNWDPTLLSRGVVSHGKVEIHGSEKTAFLKADDAPMAGDTVIKLSETPDNWSVGDTIVLTGTHKMGWTYTSGKVQHTGTQDEEVTITAINGKTITIDQPLQFDHDTPRDDLNAYVANMSRNVTFSSEDGDQSEIHHRGHVMFMHNDDVDVRYVAFDDLGRTDKSRPAMPVDKLNNIESDSNIQARYSFHFHRTGTENQDEPAIAMGNTVNGSPGWAFVHHSSNADFIQNISFDSFGAGFVAEDGDETGLWWQNMAINSVGIGFGGAKVKSNADLAIDDVARTGDGFYFRGRMVEAGENIAANTTHGFTWMTRAPKEYEVTPETKFTDHPDAYFGADVVKANSMIPIQGFHENEAFGTQAGLIVVRSTPGQEHDVRSVMDGFLNWETSDGVLLSYTSHYTMKNFDIIGTANEDRTASAQTGISYGKNVFDVTINGGNVEGFRTGIDLDQPTQSDWANSDYGHVLIDVELSDNEIDLNGFNKKKHQILTADDLDEGRLEFDLKTDLTIGWENIPLDGLKTDSIGSRERQFAADEQEIGFQQHIREIMKRDGYYETADGDTIVLVPDYVADRATGDLLKFNHVVTLELPPHLFKKVDTFNNGLIDLDSAAPITKDDTRSTAENKSIVIDVLANDHDPDGDDLEVDWFTNPMSGDLLLLDSGKLLYTPHEDATGRDTFQYWAADDQGLLTTATVTVDVGDF